MIRALAMKEWREIRAFGALALGVSLIYLASVTGLLSDPMLRAMPWASRTTGRPPDLPFVRDGFIVMLGLVGSVLAIALGLRQSAWEPHQGTSLYLLHLPMPRRTILATKILTGVGLLLACALVPILLYGTWAAWPRTHAGPFEWSMTADALRVWAMTPLVYLAAFASGIRPARWFGTRLLPLAVVAAPAILTLAVPSWWLIGLPIAAVTAAVLTAAVVQEAETRDY